MKTQETKDFEDGQKYGQEHPRGDCVRTFHEAIGTAPDRSDSYKKGVEIGKDQARNK